LLKGAGGGCHSLWSEEEGATGTGEAHSDAGKENREIKAALETEKKIVGENQQNYRYKKKRYTEWDGRGKKNAEPEGGKRRNNCRNSDYDGGASQEKACGKIARGRDKKNPTGG